MATRRNFLKAAALAPVAAAAAPGALVEAAAQAPQTAAAPADATGQARAQFEAMKAMLGRTYTSEEEARIMRRLEAGLRESESMAHAGLKNWDEPVTIFFAEREPAHAPAGPKGAR